MRQRNDGVLLLVVSLALMGGAGPAAAGRDQPFADLGLADLAARVRPGFLIGAHTKAEQVTGGPDTAVLLKNYNLISVGIYQRQTQRRSAEDWDFSRVDPVVAFAAEHGLTVYAHPLFGSNGYIPDWLLEGGFTDAQLLGMIEERVKTVLRRYRGRIHILDVYNEGLSRSGPDWRERDNLLLQLGYHENEIGRWPVALERILIACRRYGGPDLKLVYNDNNNTLLGMPQAEGCIRMVRALRRAGIPIDGIGIQCHTRIGADGVHRLSANPRARGPVFEATRFARNLQAMGEAGIEVYISECDVHLYGSLDERMFRLQAEAYRSILQACIEAPACRAFKTWGFTDASCWKPLNKQDKSLVYEPCPLVFDHALQPKPAYRAMQSWLIETLERTERGGR